MGNGFVTLVCQTETPLLAMGEQVLPLARAAQEGRHGAPQRSVEQPRRLDTQLAVARAAPYRIERQSRRLTQGKSLPHGKIVTAYDPTIAPSGNGKRNCPAPWSNASWPACCAVERRASPTKVTAVRSSKRGGPFWRPTRQPWSASTRIVSRSGHACSAEGCACDAVQSINTMPQSISDHYV